MWDIKLTNEIFQVVKRDFHLNHVGYKDVIALENGLTSRTFI